MEEKLDLSEYKDEFLKETQEVLDNLNQTLLELEKEPNNQMFINEVFRGVHSLKGMAATMGFDKITTLSHEMEDILAKIRANEIKISINITDILFECLDALEDLVNEIAQGKEGKRDYSLLIEELGEIKKGVEKPLLFKNHQTPIIRRIKTIRVSTNILDSFMNLVGEMLICKNKFKNIAHKYKIAEIDETLNTFDRLTSDLEHEALKMRFVPAEQTFNRFPRMVRDLAKEQGKELDFIIEGKEIELDRLMLDNLSDPLVHLLRNAIDHGIERPKEREKKGKTRVGKLKLIAKRQEGLVIIVVDDDGKGIDPKDIKRIAVEKGIISPEEVSKLDEYNSLRLIFSPAFTATREATKVSGRGVGLDIVRAQVESLHGSIEIRSKKDIGTKFILKMPLTTVIIQALLIGLKNEVYAIPLIDVIEILKINPKDVRSIQGKDVVSVREKLISFISLDKVLNIAPKENDAQPFAGVLIKKAEGSILLGLDSIIGKQEIVVKPLPPSLKKINGFAGTTILTDGKPALILDISNLI
jgi:two-component system chemotaxis sensor kinase CheA